MEMLYQISYLLNVINNHTYFLVEYNIWCMGKYMRMWNDAEFIKLVICVIAKLELRCITERDESLCE